MSSATTKFDADTAVTKVADGLFEGNLSADWSIARGANGGHLAAILLRAIRETLAVDTREARSLSVHFARVPRHETFRVRTLVERRGRTMSNVSARMEQDEKVIALGICVASDARSGPDFSELSMPEVPPPDAIDPAPQRPDFPFGHRFDFRPVLNTDRECRTDKAELGVWMRLRELQPVDDVAATQLLDAFAPAVFAKQGYGGRPTSVPTVEMTFYYRESLPVVAPNPSGWCLGIFRTALSRDGFIDEDGWLWAPDGTLIAQSRQLALIS